jgi:phospholipase C
MGYYIREDLPFHYALADAFTVCDRYFCSVFGPTHPNRVISFSGTADPDVLAGGPVVSNAVPAPLRWTTYPERLQAAGVSCHSRPRATGSGHPPAVDRAHRADRAAPGTGSRPHTR